MKERVRGEWIRPRPERVSGSASALAAALLLALGGCGGAGVAVSSGAAGKAASSPAGLQVERSPWADRLLLTGELVADDAAVLVVPNANIWPVSVRWLVEDGSQVQAGDRVAEFDGAQLSGRLENLEDRLASARAFLGGAIDKARSDEEKARFELLKKQRAHEKAKLQADLPDGLLAEQEMAQRRLDLTKAELELKRAEAALGAAQESGRRSIEVQEILVRKAERQLERAHQGLEKLTLYAPRDGIALVAFNDQEGRAFKTGDSAYPGFGVVTLPRLESLRVEAQLFDVDDGRIAAGQEVVATLDAFPDWQIQGTVRSVDLVADEIGRFSTRRRFRVAVDLAEVDVERMRPGMSAKIVATTAPRDALVAPRQAIDWGGESPALRIRGGGLKTVEIGECNPTICEILGGVEAGTRLAPALGGAQS